MSGKLSQIIEVATKKVLPTPISMGLLVKNHNHDTDILLQIFEVRIEVTCPIPNADCSAKFNGV
jgi:hypothetical protein